MKLTEQQIKDGALRFSRKDVNHQTNFINAVNWAQEELGQPVYSIGIDPYSSNLDASNFVITKRYRADESGKMVAEYLGRPKSGIPFPELMDEMKKVASYYGAHLSNEIRPITEDYLKDLLFEFDEMEEWWNKALPSATIISVKIGDEVEVCVFGGGFTDSYDATGCKTLKDLDNLIKLFS